MVTIQLQNAAFFAHHGFYAEEQVIGGNYFVDVAVSYQPTANPQSDEIGDTINYEQLYDICCQQMKERRKLLETVASSIAEQIKSRWTYASSVIVTVRKAAPPLAGPVEYSAVTVQF